MGLMKIYKVSMIQVLVHLYRVYSLLLQYIYITHLTFKVFIKKNKQICIVHTISHNINPRLNRNSILRRSKNPITVTRTLPLTPPSPEDPKGLDFGITPFPPSSDWNTPLPLGEFAARWFVSDDASEGEGPRMEKYQVVSLADIGQS